jgi:uncharacterized protein (TIGR02246 family)
MRTAISKVVAFGFLGLTIAGCAQTNQQPVAQAAAATGSAVQPDQARADLAKARAEFTAAYNAADTDRFVAMFADNGSYSGLRQTTWVQGKDEIHSMWAIAFTKDKARNFVFGDLITTFSDDNKVAVDIGHAGMMMAAKAGTPISGMSNQPMRVSITWVQTEQGWRILSMAASPEARVAPGFLKGH